jgi:putative addiction module component (TIGR02574 family)
LALCDLRVETSDPLVAASAALGRSAEEKHGKRPVDCRRKKGIVSAMSSLSLRIPGLAEASVEEKLELIDELWESVRRAGTVEIPKDHLAELEKRAAEVSRDPSIALSPAQARSLLKK